PPGSGADLRSVAAVGRSVWAVGPRGVARHSLDSGVNWLPVELGTRADLSAVAVVPGDDVIAAGEHGTIVRIAPGKQAIVEDSGTVNDLLGVAIRADARFVVGAGGAILSAPR